MGSKVHICFLPPGCSSLIQPLNISVFKLVKEEYRELVEHYLRNDTGTDIVPNGKFVEFWGIARDKQMNEEHIRTGFEKTGLYRIDKMKLLRSLKLETREKRESSKPVRRKRLGGRKRFDCV